MWQDQLEDDKEMTNAVASKSPKETQGLSFIRIVNKGCSSKCVWRGGKNTKEYGYSLLNQHRRSVPHEGCMMNSLL